MTMLEERSASSVGPFQGSPKTLFFLGLFAGIAICTTLALVFVVSSIASGKGISLGSGANPYRPAAAVADKPSPAVPPNAQPPGQAPAGKPVKPVDEKLDHVLGTKNAKVTLIEYSDFECPFCKRHFTTMQQLFKDYSKDLRIVFRHFPLSFHQNAQKEAEASECAAELGGNVAFWKLHDKIFTETTAGGTGLSLARLTPMAKEIGLDEARFKTCLDSGKYATKVNQDLQEGSAAGVEGTPATFVNGQLISGAVPLNQFKQVIDGLLKK